MGNMISPSAQRMKQTKVKGKERNRKNLQGLLSCKQPAQLQWMKMTQNLYPYIRVLFDNGSQRSYITDSLKSKLGLTSMKRETIHLNTFGDSKYKTQKCHVFMLKFKSSEGQTFPISALNFRVICKPLGTRFDVLDYPHLQDLELADCPTNERQCIDVLIGSDQYWDFVTARGRSRPVQQMQMHRSELWYSNWDRLRQNNTFLISKKEPLQLNKVTPPLLQQILSF